MFTKPIAPLWSKRLLLFCSSLLVVFVASIGLDRVVGLFANPHEQGLVFPRQITVRFETPEFSSTVKTNSMGFRDREFSSQKSVKTRIVTLGDSFTFGWGVEAEESWPKVLEARLRSAGLDVEVANLGKPGGSPQNYANIAEQSIALLHPDLLIVGILQGDDLAQMDLLAPPASTLGQDREPSNLTARHQRLRQVAGRLYPHFLKMIDDSSRAALSDQWKRDAQIFMTVFTAEEKVRLGQLDARVKNAFFAGELNPSLIYLGIHSPDYFAQTMDINSAKNKLRVSQMSEQLVRIKAAADQINAKVIVVSVPYGIYVSPASFESRRRVGFTATPEMLTSNAEDEAINMASKIAGVPFHEVTREFRQTSSQRELFFELDGHFNSAGHRYFAELLTPLVQKQIAAHQPK